MFSILKKMKTVKQWEKDLVIGYTKGAEKLSLHTQIPMAISYLCLIYNHEHDYFEKFVNPEAWRINENKNEITVRKKKAGWVVGHHDINNHELTYIWTIKVSGMFLHHYACIGSYHVSNNYDNEPLKIVGRLSKR